MTFDPIIQTEDVPASQEGLHRVDPERPPQSRLQQRQTPETVLLEGEDGDQEKSKFISIFLHIWFISCQKHAKHKQSKWKEGQTENKLNDLKVKRGRVWTAEPRKSPWREGNKRFIICPVRRLAAHWDICGFAQEKIIHVNYSCFSVVKSFILWWVKTTTFQFPPCRTGPAAPYLTGLFVIWDSLFVSFIRLFLNLIVQQIFFYLWTKLEHLLNFQLLRLSFTLHLVKPN